MTGFESKRQAAQDKMELADAYASAVAATPNMPTPLERKLAVERIERARNALEAALEQQAEPVAWMHEGTLGRYFNENRNDVHSIPLYCASMTHDSDFIQIPVAYQYAYPDGVWRCSYGDEINGSRPISSRALYARKDGK